RLGLPTRRELVPEVGGHRAGVGPAGAPEAQAVLGQRAALLPPLHAGAGRPHSDSCLIAAVRGLRLDCGRSWLETIGCWPCWARPTRFMRRSWRRRAARRHSSGPGSPGATTPHSPTPACSPPPSASSSAGISPV